MRVVAVAVVGALLLGGCVAGAARDSARSIRQARQEPPYSAPDVIQTASGHPYGSAVQTQSHSLAEFTDWMTLRGDGAWLGSDGRRVAYEDRDLQVTVSTGKTARDRLPTVMHMHPLEAATLRTRSGRPAIIVSKRSRATTGLIFIAAYGEEGLLYRAIQSAGEVWDIVPVEDGFTMLGASTALTISLP